jgi:hypothetical protein
MPSCAVPHMLSLCLLVICANWPALLTSLLSVRCVCHAVSGLHHYGCKWYVLLLLGHHLSCAGALPVLWLQVWLLYTQGVKGLGMGFSTGWDTVDKHYKVSTGRHCSMLQCVLRWCPAHVHMTGPARSCMAALNRPCCPRCNSKHMLREHTYSTSCCGELCCSTLCTRCTQYAAAAAAAALLP